MNDIADSASLVHPDAAMVSAWEEPRRIDRDAAPVLAVDGFEGPLDWWLEMARAQKIDLAKLSIAALIETFATAMEAALSQRVEGQLARWAVWTVMAATLTELRSRLLLPPDAPAHGRPWKKPRHCAGRYLTGRRCGSPPVDWNSGRNSVGTASAEASRRRPRPPPLWTASDAIAHLSRLLAVLPDRSPLAAFLPTIPHDAPGRELRCRAAVSSTLIAGLERARDGALALDQDADWLPIRVLRRDTHAPDAGDAGGSA